MVNLGPVGVPVRKADKVGLALFGAFGGACPTLAKLAATYAAATEIPPPLPTVWIAIAIFAVIGMFVALGFGSDSHRQALVAGIAAPALITNILNGATGQAPKAMPLAPIHEPAKQSSTFLFVTGAFAQSSPSATAETASSATPLPRPKAVVVDTTVSGPAPSNTLVLSVTRKLPTGGTEEVGLGSVAGTVGPKTVLFPEGTIAYTVGPNKTILPKDFQAASKPEIKLEVKTAPSPTSDFLWALGGKRTFDVRSVESKIQLD